MEKGNNLTRASVTELTAAETITDLIPSAEMVKLLKTAPTSPPRRPRSPGPIPPAVHLHSPSAPFFSFDDWFIGTTPMKRGIPENHVGNTLVFDYGDMASLQRHFDEHPGDCRVLEPATTETPCPRSCSRELTYDNPRSSYTCERRISPRRAAAVSQ